MAAPDSIQEVLNEDDPEDPTGCYVDKAWHGIHFLLNGAAYTGDGPLFNVVLGGTEIGEDLGYGPARYLTADQVREAAAAFGAISDDELRQRYNPRAFEDADIYPNIWVDEGDEALDYVMEYLTQLRAFFLAAAQAGQAMLLYIS
ncbi:MAG TPA: YfbM family protein [Symbiobacteriaceae bacterium]|nr:YfbM family protein [Symbiobacteriaceae bacterium]